MHRAIVRLALVLSLGLLAQGACQKSEEKTEAKGQAALEVVAEVGSARITAGDLLGELKIYKALLHLDKAEAEDDSGRIKNAVLYKLIKEAVLKLEADRSVAQDNLRWNRLI